MHGYGNMTSVEKRMNKDDLIAYKNFDNNQYAMIPGHAGLNKTALRSTYLKDQMSDYKEESPIPSRNGARYQVNKSMDNIRNARSLV
jgi:hypothetical protein